MQAELASKTSRSTIKYLLEVHVESYIDNAISVVYLYTRSKKGQKKDVVYMAELVAAIGHSIRSSLRLRRDSPTAARTGAFILYSFEALGMLKVVMGQGANMHMAYVVQLEDDEMLCKLWESVDIEKVEKLPSLVPYAKWTGYRHETGQLLVKTGNKEVLNKLTPETHPIVFNVVNKAQEVGWTINKNIYDLHTWALRNKTDAFSDIWNAPSSEAKATKMREAKAIGSIAKRFLGRTFYHLYYYDFRGRKYTSTAYLNEQGSDLARGMIIPVKEKPLTEKGFFWLMVCLASNLACDAGREDGRKTDKIPLKDRYHWSVDNEEILLSYAESPKVNQGWMKADKPWQFLALCFELKRLREWQVKKAIDLDLPIDSFFTDYSFLTAMEGYIDGSNNGSQHLTALTRDEETAPHVNLVPQDLPGDLYKYVGDHVWKRLKEAYSNLPLRRIYECEDLIDHIIDMKKKINETLPKTDARRDLADQLMLIKEVSKPLMDDAGIVFWMRISDAKHQRKIVKRNVMTLPYGGTSYGLGQQQIDDARKHGIDLLNHLEHRWGAMLGRIVFEDCKVSMKRPMQLLSVFEAAGKAAEDLETFLSWTVPITNFPVVQHYTEGEVKKVWVQYGPPKGDRLNTGYFENTYQLLICHLEKPKLSKGKQAQGASPNAIHSLDAAHLALTVDQANFPITTIHDSFGCHLSDLPDLFNLVRKTFVELHSAHPLEKIMADIGGDLKDVLFGTLDISLFLDSEYGFS